MKCPTCPDSVLLMTERQGVEIDHCAQCRGVWLDRGELDKLIALSSATTPATAPARPMATAAREDFADSDHRPSSGYYPRRKKSWLSDIFD
ncbi:MAG TPA: zf-TFIIB domain-containing protein [Polaromonas sp.]|uniref:TFIIB-type zinc ribbon-containing protein n=1 Tax=Polaromonas sp. TaxID=1869339 RepID=UPI002D6BF2B2|nr:zf-TFIIB domain-containing protein [Polaromonas sp.]HYW56561.1 zf-TFIIB domain-containing protein [Polaromonas sp.]